MNITKDIKYVGVNDFDIDLFEGKYEVPKGMAYNSYVIFDEKIAVMDTVDAFYGDDWFNNLKAALGDKKPSYLVIHHMEPDHSANINEFMAEYPEAVIVASERAFVFMKQFYGNDYAERRIIVKEGGTLMLGKHSLTFVAASMVHWPEVIMSYDKTDKVVFSADAFGKFGALNAKEEWACEARRYYFNIVGKYGTQVQNVLNKLSAFDIETICPLHGPILTENLGYYLDLYNTWSSYKAESEGVMIAYTSVYGNTKRAVELLAKELKANGCEKVVVTDLARCDMSEAVEDAFRYGKIVFATTTYNSGVFPFMREFLAELAERDYRNRTIGIIENGSWAPQAAKKIKETFEKSKNIVFAKNVVSIKSAMTAENRATVAALAKELCE